MIEWTADAIVLAARPHGESAMVAELLTRAQGRCAGLVQAGQSKRMRAVLQPGNQVSATWRARLADHLGRFSLELTAARASRFFEAPGRLSALASAAALTAASLPEREPHPACYDGFLALLDALEGEHWAEVYVQWELLLLSDLGYGLDLSQCAAGGENDQLAYVSPRTGRAVSLSAAEPYRDRLLPLPPFLAGRGEGGEGEVAQGLALTAHFLERHIFHPRDRALPDERLRLAQRFSAAA